MIPILLKRVVHGLIVLWIVATFTFLLLRVAPGGPFDSERKLPPEVLANLEAKYHLNEPVLAAILPYLGGIARGDLGPSYKYLDRGVHADHLRNLADVQRCSAASRLCLRFCPAFPIGLLRAYYRGSLIDRWCLFVATLGISLAEFYSWRAADLALRSRTWLASSRAVG